MVAQSRTLAPRRDEGTNGGEDWMSGRNEWGREGRMADGTHWGSDGRGKRNEPEGGGGGS